MCSILEAIGFALLTDSKEFLLMQLFLPPTCLLFKLVGPVFSQLESPKELLGKLLRHPKSLNMVRIEVLSQLGAQVLAAQWLHWIKVSQT